MATQQIAFPEGLTKQDVEAVSIRADGWRKSDLYACRQCGEPAYLHPYTNTIWGCKKCDYSTYSVFVYFFELGAEVYDESFPC